MRLSTFTYIYTGLHLISHAYYFPPEACSIAVPSPIDALAVLSFGPTDTLLTPAQHYIPTRLFPPLRKIQVKNRNILPFSTAGIFHF